MPIHLLGQRTNNAILLKLHFALLRIVMFLKITMISTVLTRKLDGIRQLFNLSRRQPSHLSNKTAIIYVLLAVVLVFAVASVEIPIQYYFPASYPYLYIPTLLIASAIGIAYTHDRLVLSSTSMYFVLAAIPISVTIFYVRVWLTGPVVIEMGHGWPKAPFLVGHFLLVCIFIPFSEEVVTRTLFFVGVARYVGFLSAAVITSILFAVAHPERIPAFIVSCVLCYMAYRGISESSRNTNLVARTLFHSIYNVVVIGLTFYNGSGRF